MYFPHRLRGSRKAAKEAAKAEQAEKEARRKAIYEKWNSGMVQKKERERLIEDTLHEASKPLARAADDADLDERLRAVSIAFAVLFNLFFLIQIIELYETIDQVSYFGKISTYLYNIDHVK